MSIKSKKSPTCHWCGRKATKTHTYRHFGIKKTSKWCQDCYPKMRDLEQSDPPPGVGI